MNGDYQQFLPWLFPRFLGGVYFIAFLSLLVQVSGLYGSNGVLSIAAYLKAVQEEAGKDAYLICPTLFWFNSSDRALTGATLLGTFLSILLVGGGPPVPLLLVLWVLYLSFVSAARTFSPFSGTRSFWKWAS